LGQAWRRRIVASAVHRRQRRATVILTLVFVFLVLWFFGLMTSYTLGGMLHILLVVAIVLFLVHLIQGRSIGNA
jgi:low affinity Fe/Cu permease